MSAPLPPKCPLCEGNTWVCPGCGNGLAAPPLQPEVVAVLQAAERFAERRDLPVRHACLVMNTKAWIAAGRPGLPDRESNMPLTRAEIYALATLPGDPLDVFEAGRTWDILNLKTRVKKVQE